MGRELIDLYNDYLLCSSRQTTATGLSELTGGVISHDRMTRFLLKEVMDEKTPWLEVKKLVRCHELEDKINYFGLKALIYAESLKRAMNFFAFKMIQKQ